MVYDFAQAKTESEIYEWESLKKQVKDILVGLKICSTPTAVETMLLLAFRESSTSLMEVNHIDSIIGEEKREKCLAQPKIKHAIDLIIQLL